MAEGYTSAKYSDRYEGLSAGTKVTQVHLLAIRAMDEIGIDISHHRSKALIEFFDRDIDLVKTVCDSANAACPMFPGPVRSNRKRRRSDRSGMRSSPGSMQIWGNFFRDSFIP
jgi:arsenate reductase